MPASSSSASVDWRCEVDGGWTTIVWTLPSEAVSSGRLQRVDDRPAGLPAALDLEGEHPAGHPGPELAQRRPRAADGSADPGRGRAHAVLTLEPGRECRGRRGVALGPDGEGQDPAQDEERLERPEGRAGVDLDPLDLGDQPRAARPRRPAMTSLWPPRNLVADSTTRSAPSSSGRQTYGEANVLSTT